MNRRLRVAENVVRHPILLESARQELRAARETFEHVGAVGLIVDVEQEELALTASGAGA